MNKNYNLRQRKIYNDYIGYSTDSLMDMMKSGKYIDEVTEVFKDILRERNATPIYSEQETINSQAIENDDKEVNEFINNELSKRKIDVNFYIKQLEGRSDKDLSEIITKYTSYQLALVEAALITSEKREIISSHEKEKLLKHIEKGYDDYNRNEEFKAQLRIKKSLRRMNTGLILAVIGVLLSIGTWIHPIGGYSIIFYGFIVSGIYLIYKGFFMSN